MAVLCSSSINFHVYCRIQSQCAFMELGSKLLGRNQSPRLPVTSEGSGISQKELKTAENRDLRICSQAMLFPWCFSATNHLLLCSVRLGFWVSTLSICSKAWICGPVDVCVGMHVCARVHPFWYDCCLSLCVHSFITLQCHLLSC